MEQDEIKTLETQDYPEKEQDNLTIPESLDDNLEKAIEVLGTLSKEQRTILSRGMLAIQQSYSGPLPPAKEFKGYKEVLPDAPERILSMAERNNENRIRLTNKAERHDFFRTILGQVFGFVLSIGFGGGAIYLGALGHDVLAGTLGCTTVISLAGIFVLNRLPQFNKDSE